jgi:hypothetical protein
MWRKGHQDPDGVGERILREHFSVGDLKTTRVLCLTDDRANKHLWQKYADNGRGCVLEFRHIREADTTLQMARPVQYSSDVPRLDRPLDFMLYGATRALKMQILHSVCLSKSESWQPEREWRVVDWSPKEIGRLHADYSFNPVELASVTIGPQFDISQLPELQAILRARYAVTSLFRMPSSYEASKLLCIAR